MSSATKILNHCFQLNVLCNKGSHLKGWHRNYVFSVSHTPLHIKILTFFLSDKLHSMKYIFINELLLRLSKT